MIKASIRFGTLVACLPVLLFGTVALPRAATAQVRRSDTPLNILPVPYDRAAENARRSGVAPGATLFGFTPFPFDRTAQAVATVRATTVPNQTLYALQLDNGIPWAESIADTPLPRRIQEEWNQIVRSLPPNCPVCVGIAPLATDRKSLAPARGEQDDMALPDAIAHAPLDDPILRRAYLNYARRVVRTFHPRFLNLGIEAGELMSRDPARWPEFVRLYRSVHGALKREFPDTLIGISFGLGDLRNPREAQMARGLIADSDYVGLSFYPYTADFDAKFGAPPYAAPGSAPSAQWREPLRWIRAYTDKPIALCETGYSTRNVDLPAFGLHLIGSAQQQAAYVGDLFTIATRDRYLFMVYYLSIDYDRLYATLPPGSEAALLWRNIGLIDSDLHPKPAWDVWKAGVDRAKARDSGAKR